MKERDNFLNDIVLIITEHLLLLPLTLFLLVMTGWGRLELFYGPVILFSVLMAVVWKHMPDKRRLVICGAILAVNTVLMILVPHPQKSMILGIVMGTGFLVRSCFVAGLGSKEFSFSIVLVFGFIFYVIGALLYKNYEPVKSYGTLVAIAATLTVVAVLYIMNQSHFGNERKVVNKVSMISATTHRTNIFLLAMFSILVLFIAALGFMDQVWAFFLKVLKFLKDLREAIWNWYNSIFGVGYLEGMDLSPRFFGNPGELSSKFKAWGYYFMLAVICLSLALCIYIAVKVILKWVIIPFIRYLKMLLKAQNSADNAQREYEDEVTSLLKEGESAWDAARRWLANRGGDSGRPYRLLSNNSERARWLYKQSARKALRKGLAINQAMTAGEVLEKIGRDEDLPPEIASAAGKAYNAARYGSKEPADEDIKTMMKLYSSKSPRV